MSREPDFDASADMRLLELQRTALGLHPPSRPAWESRIPSDGSIITAEPAPQAGGAVLTVEASASPTLDLIPGAVVTLSLSVHNDGQAPASDITLAVPLPGGVGYRPGSFQRDGRPAPDDEAERFFGSGIVVASMAAHTRRTFSWKIGVKLGVKPLVIAAQVQARGAAIVGAKALVLHRKDAPAGAFSHQVARIDPALYESRPVISTPLVASELPIYELDAEEQLVYEAADAALSTAAPVPPTLTPTPATQNINDVHIESAQSHASPPAAELQAPEAQPPTKPPPEPQLQPQLQPQRQDACILLGTFDRPTLAFFERTFHGGKPATILQHCIFAGALACTRWASDGQDAAGLKRHFDAQSQIMHRIGLHERLGKREPITEYAGELLAALDEIVPSPLPDRPALESDASRLILMAELAQPTRDVLHRLAEQRDRWDFVRARQLTLALQAQRVIGGSGTDAQRAALEEALRVYAQSAMTALQKLFVRIRIDRTTGLLAQPEPALDTAAKAVLAAFAPLFLT